MQLIIFCGTFTLRKELKSASCVTLSKAFSQSSERIIVEVFVDSPLAMALLIAPIDSYVALLFSKTIFGFLKMFVKSVHEPNVNSCSVNLI